MSLDMVHRPGAFYLNVISVWFVQFGLSSFNVLTLMP